MGRLSRSTMYYGVFTNAEGKQKDAYIWWDSERGGFVIKDLKGKLILPTAFKTFAEIGDRFVRTEPVQTKVEPKEEAPQEPQPEAVAS